MIYFTLILYKFGRLSDFQRTFFYMHCFVKILPILLKLQNYHRIYEENTYFYPFLEA